MADAFIYDHVRTPRGRGKPDGALHEVTALSLAAQTLAAIRDRNELDTNRVDDVVLGCVDPIGEAGGDIARAAALVAGYGNEVPGVQINRFCASGLDAINFAAAQVMAGQHQVTIGGGVESMSRVGIGASGGAWPMDPSLAVPTYFMPQGISADVIATRYGFSRDDVDAYAVESQKRAGKAWEENRFNQSVVPVKDINGLTLLAKERPGASMRSPCRRIPRSSLSTTCTMRAIRRASSMAPPRCSSAARRPGAAPGSSPAPRSRRSPTSGQSPPSC
jgi:acetyl-CoA C-acetyltransferase